MRIRSVNPDLCMSEKMAELHPALERTFIRLWMHCDDEGRCLDNLRLIKAAIYPLVDQVSIERLDKELMTLEQANLLVRYTVHAKHYIAVRSWEEYQHPQRPRPSKYPPPPEPLADDSRTSPVQLPEGYDDESDTDQSGLQDVYVPGGEGRGEGVGVIASLDATRKRKRRDPLWDAVLSVCGISEVTSSARGAYNRAVKDLRELEAAPDEVPKRAAVYHRRWPDVSLTPNALARHWGECTPQAATGTDSWATDPSNPEAW